MKTLLKVLLLFACFWSISAFAQIGPLPCGAVSSITTWRQDFPYLIGQVVILNGVTYQSLTNNNLNQNPCTYSGTQWSNIVGTGMGPTFNLANYTTLGLAPSGKAYVIPAQITGSITDAFQAIDAQGATLPSTGGTIDATGLGTGTFTVTHQLTALNQPGKPVTLLLNSGTKFLINTSFASPTNTPASCAVPVGPGNGLSQGSAIVVPGANYFGGNFVVGPSARVWDVVCNGDFTGNQETLRLDGVTVQGNSSATVMGSLMHLAGVFTPTHIDNSGTYQCFAQCLRLDAGTTGSGGSALGNISFSNDHFSDTYGTGGTYPGSVVLMDALTSQGEITNVNFFGGMIEGNGPHNPLLVINGRGGVQTSSIGFFGTTFQTSAATTSVSNTNVDPIQLIDASQVYFSNLRVAGNTNAAQANLVDISTTTSSKVSYGINIDQISVLTGAFTCLVHNSIDSPATCETGYSTGAGDVTSANYTYGQVFPILRQTTYSPSGSCINGSLWGNSAGTTAATTNFQCINGAWVGFASGGGGGGTPGGSNTQVQFNNSGAFGADATFTFNNSTKTLFVQNVSISGSLTTGPILNGVSYSQNYSGSTVDVRVNACLADAMALTNGNTTGICDASAETGILNTAAQINVGSSTGPQVGLIVPCQGQWRGNMTDGTSYTINQYGNTTIKGACGESGIGSQFVFGATTGSNLGGIFKLTPLGSQLNYIHDSNFSIVNVNGGPYTGHVTTGGIGANFVGPMYDSSTVDHVVVFDALDATAAKVSGFCCGAVFRNMSINGNYGSGVTPLVITNTSAFDMETLSVVHPGATKPIIQFTDTSSHTSNVNIHGLYMETSNSDTTTALLQNSGYGSINLSDVTAKAEVTSDAATIMTSTNTTNTGITITGFNAVNGAGDFLYPVTVVNNSFTSEIVTTDSSGAKGNLGYYASTNIGSLPAGTGIVATTNRLGRIAVPGTDYVYPFAFNGMGPQGQATSSTNFGSNQFQLTGSCWDGTTHQNDFYAMGSVPAANGSGALMLNVFNHFGGCNSSALGIFTYPVSFGNGISAFNVDAKYFGAHGDAFSPLDGCITNNASNVINCNGPFISTAVDGGKDIWVHGAGAAGVAFHATIVSVTDANHAVMSATPSISLSNTPGNTVYGHDDVTPIQACFQFSANNSIPCALIPAQNPPGQGLQGFLIGSAGLQLVSASSGGEVSATNFYGSSQVHGTDLFCEFNGDCLSMAAGRIQGANVSNIEFFGDPTQPNGRGMHFAAAAGIFGDGGLWQSNITNVNVENFAKECLLSEGGGGPGYAFNLPNQIDQFYQFYCQAPNQMHTANLIKMTGQHAQIAFFGGQTNGPGTEANQPNAMILITEKTNGLSDSPNDVKFFAYTYEVGTKGLQIDEGGYNIHYDNGYVENVATPLIAGGTGGTYGLTYNGNHIANSGNTTSVAQFTGGVTGGMRDNLVYGGTTPAAFAICTNSGNNVEFGGNQSSVNIVTGCTPTIAVSGGTQGANSCSSASTKTVTGVYTSARVDTTYSSDPSAIAGWGGTSPGMVIQTWPSAQDTVSWKLCNQTGSSITYGAITFNVGYK